jgi:hypothetical protein
MSDYRQPGRAARGLRTDHLSPEELAIIAASLRELADRLDGFRQRLSALETAVQASSGSTTRSTRASRSSIRPRSS